MYYISVYPQHCTVFDIYCVLSHVQFFVTPWTVACQAPLSMELSRQEYWSGLLCLPPGDLSSPEIEPASLNISGLLGLLH